MSSNFMTTKPLSRQDGRSLDAHLAYRSASEVGDFDYSAKRSVVNDFLLHADPAVQAELSKMSLGEFASKIEGSEKRKDARLIREFVIALPAELHPLQREKIACDYALFLSESFGGAVHVAIHKPDGNRRGEHRPAHSQLNHHAHLTCTDRAWGCDGPEGPKIREWNKKGWLRGVAQEKYEFVSSRILADPLPEQKKGSKRVPIGEFKSNLRQIHHESEIAAGRRSGPTDYAKWVTKQNFDRQPTQIEKKEIEDVQQRIKRSQLAFASSQQRTSASQQRTSASQQLTSASEQQIANGAGLGDKSERIVDRVARGVREARRAIQQRIKTFRECRRVAVDFASGFRRRRQSLDIDRRPDDPSSAGICQRVDARWNQQNRSSEPTHNGNGMHRGGSESGPEMPESAKQGIDWDM